MRSERRLGRGIEGLKKIFDVMVDKSKGNILSPLSLGDLVCVRCAKQLEDAHLRFREQFAWEALPGLLGGRWEGVWSREKESPAPCL